MKTMELLFNRFQTIKTPRLETPVSWFDEEDGFSGSCSATTTTKAVAEVTPTKSTEASDDCDICPLCSARDSMDLSELVTCKSCGYVISRPFDTTAEYRFFSNDDRGGDPTRVGAAQDPSLPQASLGTVILGSYGAAAKTMYKVRKYHTWNTVPYKERSLIQANERLTLIGLNHGINQSAIEASRSLYITIKEIGGRQGLSRDAMLAGCMYLVLKESGSPRKPKDIAEIFGLSSATFTKALKQLQEVLAMARQKGLLNNNSKSKNPSSSTKAVEYIALPLSKLPLQRAQADHLTTLCIRVAERVEELGLGQENMPPSLAAGCVAFVLKRCEVLDIPLTQIAEVSEISIATLQKCLRRLELHAGDLEKFFTK
uniref:Transcription factor TFIIB cyclin-like domain-containing protein n=1 Tax=viral metagenome TaxID=1070528 RepID=A0A6C0DJK8_9ZZZZ